MGKKERHAEHAERVRQWVWLRAEARKAEQKAQLESKQAKKSAQEARRDENKRDLPNRGWYVYQGK